MTKEEIIKLMNKLANQSVEAMELIDQIDELYERLGKVYPELYRTVTVAGGILTAFEMGMKDVGPKN